MDLYLSMVLSRKKTEGIKAMCFNSSISPYKPSLCEGELGVPDDFSNVALQPRNWNFSSG